MPEQEDVKKARAKALRAAALEAAASSSLGYTDSGAEDQSQDAQGGGFWNNVADVFVGGGKQLGSWATFPSRAMTALGVPGYKEQDYSYLEPQGSYQQFGHGLVNAVPYVAAGGVSAPLAAGAASLYAGASPLVRYGAQAAANALIGAGTDAAAAALNDDDIATAAATGGAIPGATSLVSYPVRAFGKSLMRGARNSMGKAIGASFLNRDLDYIYKKYIDPLIKNRQVFGSLHQLRDRFKARADEAFRTANELRAQKPADLGISFADILEDAGLAKDEFRNISRPNVPGQTGHLKMAGTPEDVAAMEYIDKMLKDVRKSKIPPGLPQDIYDMTGEQAEKAGILPNLSPQDQILFDTYNNFKQDWANYARAHGKYQGKKIVGQTPEASPLVESRYQFANKSRKRLADTMGEEWDSANRAFNVNKEIAELAEQRIKAKMGAQSPLGETVVGEMHYKNPNRFLARGYLKTIHSPFWNSAVANAKDIVGNALQKTGRGFIPGSAAAWLLSGGSPEGMEGEPVEETTEPSGETPFVGGTLPNGAKILRITKVSD